MTHGSSANLEPLAPRSRLYQGPYGRICPDLPAWSPKGGLAVKGVLDALAERMRWSQSDAEAAWRTLHVERSPTQA